MELYKFFGALAIFILIIGLTFLAVKWPQGKHMTFSQHAAAYKHTILYYNLLFTITLPLLVLFFAGWFAPQFGLSVWFTACMVVSAALQYVVTLVPETGGRKTQWHRAITGVSVLLLLPALAMLYFSDSVSHAGKLLIATSLTAMVTILIYLTAINGKHKFLLIFQAGYYAAFFAPVLLLAYAGVSL